MDNNAPILRRYVAEAEECEGGAFYRARFGFPGGRIDYVRHGDEPAEYGHWSEAQSMAAIVLVESLNARQRFGSKREISHKMTGDEFAAELAETDIPLGDFAQMWGTKQEKVVGWIQGEADVPFPLRWVLRILRRPGAIEEAQKIVAENISYKPAWLERVRQRAENEEG